MKKQLKKYTKEWFIEQGKIGGAKTKLLYGLKHYQKMSEIAKVSRRAKKRVDNFSLTSKELINS